MKPLLLPAICVLLSSGLSDASKFPPGFKFGAATSAYQIEGAWNVSDKGESIWDRYVHENPELIADHSNGDVASDSYNRWMDDVKIASDLGLHFYRFSLSWPRLLPHGTPERISEDGKNYYDKLINALLQKGIEPVITLYHWDLPQRFQELGGWANPHIADWFADYARVVYSLYGDRVKTWITINEPLVICEIAFNTGVFAPGIKDPEYGNYMCSKNLLLAHAKAWRIYDSEFKPKYGGKVGITHQIIWYEAASPEHEELAELARQYSAGLYCHPINSELGGWPPAVERVIAENSKKQGFFRSRLPPFTKEEIELVKGTYDFSGINYYISRLVRRAEADDVIGPWPLGGGSAELGAIVEVDASWKKGATSWFWSFPPGLRRMLSWFKKYCGDHEVLITENGLASNEDIIDDDRVEYYRSHLEQVWLAINEDGVNVKAYTAWTLIDNFEWMDGYNVTFGLYHVDFKEPKRKRTPRASSYYYKEVIRNHSYDVDIYVDRDEL
ncbi:unnamed protein product, partial [Iphiclides podalirius]